MRAPPLFAGRYFAAARSYGSAGDAPDELSADLSADRVQADRVLQELVARLAPAAGTSGATPPALEQVAGGSPASRGACEVLRPGSGAQAVVTAVVPSRGLLVRAVGRQGVEVKLRRFGDAFSNAPVGTVAPGASRLLRLPGDRSRQPYHVQLAGPTGLAVCSP